MIYNQIIINHKEKLFTIDQKDNHISNVKIEFDKLYTKHFNTDRGPSNSIFPIFTKKRDNLTTNNILSLSHDRDKRHKSGRNHIFNQIFGFAPTVEFSVDGWIYRQPGRFISLLTQNSLGESNFQNTIQGEWLITHIDHTYAPYDPATNTTGVYRNYICCNKIYSYRGIYGDDIGD